MPYQNYNPNYWRSNNPDDYYTPSDSWSKARSFFEDLGLGFLTNPIGDAIDKKVNPGKLPDYQSGMGMNNLHKQTVYGAVQPMDERPQQPEYDATGSIIEAIGLGSMLFGGRGAAAAAKGVGAAAKTAAAASQTAKTALPSLTESVSSFGKTPKNVISSETPQGMSKNLQRSNSDFNSSRSTQNSTSSGLGSITDDNNSLLSDHNSDYNNLNNLVNGSVGTPSLRRSNTQNYSNNPLIDDNIFGNNRNLNNRNGYNQLPEESDKADSSSYHTARSYVNQNSDNDYNANEINNSYVSDKADGDSQLNDQSNGNQQRINNSFINQNQIPRIESSRIGGTGGGFGFGGNNKKYNDDSINHNDINFSLDNNQSLYSNTGLGNTGNNRVGGFSGQTLADGGYVGDKNYYDDGRYIEPDYFHIGLGSYDDYLPNMTAMYVKYDPLQQSSPFLPGEMSGTQTFGLGGIATNFGTLKRNRR